jgi:hypothetical protein
MAGDDDTQDFQTNDGLDGGELMLDEGDAEGEDGGEADGAQLQQAAQTIDFVALPIACINEGKGAPLAMGIQRWLAQELAQSGAKAAAPVFTALHEQQGQQDPRPHGLPRALD